jgi:hypothetical protein
MTNSAESVISLNAGVNLYAPDVTSTELRLTKLTNVAPKFGRWKAATRGDVISTLVLEVGDKLERLIYYTHPYDKFSQLYAISQRHIYRYDFLNDRFYATPIYSFAYRQETNIAAVAWYDKLYVTKPRSPIVEVSFGKCTEVTEFGARYSIICNNHLMIANVSTLTGETPILVQWSDLYDPTSFDFSTSSEADTFELEPQDRKITGLTNQKGVAVIYTHGGIWTGSYSNGKFSFAPLYSDVGNLFHGAVVQLREVDYFIGEDNIYSLDGTVLSTVGDAIWPFFASDCNFDSVNMLIRTKVNKQENEIAWIYPRVSGGYWSIVYNYKEQKWSDRNPDDIVSSINALYKLYGVYTINEIVNTINSMSDPAQTVNGEWQYIDCGYSKLSITFGGKVLNDAIQFYSMVDESARVITIETGELYMDSLSIVKEINRITLQYSGAGSPTITIQIGSRKSRMEAVTWSAAIEPGFVDKPIFFCRDVGVGKLIRLRINIANTDTDFIAELTGLSFDYATDNGTPEK